MLISASKIRELQRRVEPQVLVGDPPEAEGERDLGEQLVSGPEPERAALRDLDEVVGEADRRAAERDAEHRQARGVAFGEHQIGDGDREEEDQPAHRRRPGLRVMLLRALLADLLAEFAKPQERG